MSLTVCLLTRNHADQIAGALSSASFADELLVADTGSTDGTAALAAQAGARVVTVPWADDFGAACNAALDAATGSWVLWLNPDETVDPSGPASIADARRNLLAFAYYLKIQQELRADSPGSGTVGWEPRLFRRTPAVRYVGRLHPKFNPPLEVVAAAAGQSVLSVDVVVRRHAHLSTQTPDKLRWVVRLLEAELRDQPGQLSSLVDLGRHLLWLNDPRGHAVLAEASTQVESVTAAPAPPHPSVGQLLEYLLSVSPGQSQSGMSRDQARGLALRWFPRTPPVLWAVANERFAAGDFPAAADVLDRLVTMGRSGDYDPAGGFDPAIVGPAALMNLGVCHLRSGRWAAAKAALAPLLRDPAFRDRATRCISAAERQQIDAG